MKKGLAKEASAAIFQLQVENAKFAQNIERLTLAQQVTFTLFNNGEIPVENIQSTMEKLSESTTDEIEIVKKACEIHKNADYKYIFGKLSESAQDDGTLDPITRLLISDL